MKLGQKTMCCSEVDPNRGQFEPTHRVSAFSLLELLFVVLILMVLTTMYWSGRTAKPSPSRFASCQANLQKIYIAMQIYANEHTDRFPVKTGAASSEEALDSLVPKYTVDTATFICPGSKDPALPAGESLLKGRISYAYYMGRRAGSYEEPLMTDQQVDTQSKAANQLAFSASGQPPGNNHLTSGGNVLFCDGHADSTPPRSAFSLVLTQGVVLLNPKPQPK